MSDGSLTDDHPAIARAAWLPIAILAVVAAVYWRRQGFDDAWPWALAALVLAWRFRDPQRRVPSGGRAIVSPVDGWVAGVRPVPDSPLGRPALRVRILVDPLSAYPVRAPIEGRVLDPAAPGGPGRGLWLRDDEDHEVALVMHAPLRLCLPAASVDIGDRVGHGARCGALRGGWFAVLHLPADVSPRVGLGRRVLAGSTPLAELPPPRRER